MSIYTALIVDMIKEHKEKNDPVLLSEIMEKLKKDWSFDINEIIELIDDAILSENIEICFVQDVEDFLPDDEEAGE